MYKSVNIKKLMPNLSEDYLTIWDEVFKNAIKLSKYSANHSLLETCNNKPCGILTYKDIDKKYHLSYVATFPTEDRKRVPCAGQILFNGLLNRFIKSDKKNIELSAIRNAPFGPISIYLKLGFSMLGGDEFSEYMRLSRAKAVEALKKQSEFIFSNNIEKKEFVDLNNEIELNLSY